MGWKKLENRMSGVSERESLVHRQKAVEITDPT